MTPLKQLEQTHELILWPFFFRQTLRPRTPRRRLEGVKKSCRYNWRRHAQRRFVNYTTGKNGLCRFFLQQQQRRRRWRPLSLNLQNF